MKSQIIESPLVYTPNMAEIGSHIDEGSRNPSFLTRSRPNKWDLSPISVWQDMNGLDELIRLVRIIKKLIWMWYFALFNWFSNVKCQIWGKISRSQIIFFLLLEKHCSRKLSKIGIKGLTYCYDYEMKVWGCLTKTKTVFILDGLKYNASEKGMNREISIFIMLSFII